MSGPTRRDVQETADELRKTNVGGTTALIRTLNDRFRTSMIGGRILITSGVQVLDGTVKVLNLVKRFNTFNDENDPHEEHDFGAFDFRGQKIFWKIDYYDTKCEAGSADPSDPAKTTRVLTIMMASEY